MKKALCLLIASIMVLSLAGCGGSASESKTDTDNLSESVSTGIDTSSGPASSISVADPEMTDQEFHGVKYQVPTSWTISQKTDDDSIIYNSIYDGSLSDTAFVMIYFYDNEDVSAQNEKEKIDLWAYSFSESDGTSNFKKEDCLICGRYSARLTFDSDRDGAVYDMTVYTIPIYGRGILTISTTSKKDSCLDHQTYCDFILNSIELPEPSEDTPPSNSDGNNIQSSEKTDSESTTEKASTDDFVSDVKAAIDGDVGAGEAITDVKFEDGDLCVYVDLSKADPTPLTLEDLAESRTSSITDSILELTEYDDLWDTITVDFGSIGKITNGKSDIRDDGYGRYFDFDLEDLTLE